MKPNRLVLIARKVAEAIAELRRHGLQHLERHELAAHEFTALFPLAANVNRFELRRALTHFEAARTLAGIDALHTARWVMLEPTTETRDTPGPEGEVLGVIFAFVCDGNVLDVLEELEERARPAFDRVLQLCAGYSANADSTTWLDYLRRHRIRSSYMFRDTRQLDPTAPHLHASALEIRRALKLRADLRKFLIDQQGQRDVKATLRTFQAEFVSAPAANRDLDVAPGYPFALSSFERPVDHEGLWIRRTAQLARTRARRDARARAREDVLPAGLRGVHAKHHGLLEGRLRVHDDIPPRLRHGIFSPGHTYDVWVRPSNSNGQPMQDWLPDGRGVAIKIWGVHGPQLLSAPSPNGLGLPDGGTQDFTLVSHPTFFMRDAQDYAVFRSFIDARPDGRRDALGLWGRILVFAGRRPRELAIFLRTIVRWCRHPLLLEYHSLLPFLIGRAEAAKCSLRPTAATRRILERETILTLLRCSAQNPADYLKLALQRSLDELGTQPLEFEFALHVAGGEPPPVEDPRIDWADRGAQRIVVATMTIARQDATSSQRMASAENLVMTPWHCLIDHQPLGSLNRARLAAYRASLEERWKANGVERELPRALRLNLAAE
jgi:hypothetical protein